MSDPVAAPPVEPLDALVVRATPAGATPYEIEDLRSCRRWAFATRAALWAFLRHSLMPVSTNKQSGDRP
jgi:hypothetical protein